MTTHTSTEAFPQEALREAIVNAVAHRDYEEADAKITVEVFADRVVFSSPGLPPGNQKIDQIARGEGRSRARNPLIVQGLTWLEFMDERGSGIRRMRESMERHGLGLPRFALVGDEFTVTMPAGLESAETPAPANSGDAPDPLSTFKSLTDQQSAVLRRVLESGHVQTAWCVQNLGISRDTAWRLLNDLLEQGFLITTGTGRGTRYVRGNQLADQAQIGRNRLGSGANQAQIGRKDSGSGANQVKSNKPSSAVTRKQQSNRKKR
jgi:ATP-dependent DNA helicase RecG